jgi:putative hydrolase
MKPSFKKFRELRPEDMKSDFHIHTNQTDGNATPEEIIDKAMELGLNAIAFTEHVTCESTWFQDFEQQIRSLDSGKVKVYVGIETKTLDFNGKLDATEQMLDSDIVIGSVHRYPSSDGELISLEDIKSMNPQKALDIEFNSAMGMLKNSKIDVLGHPLGIYTQFHNNMPEEHLCSLFKESKKRKIAIEINTRYLTDVGGTLRLLEDTNPYVSIGSDAHKKEDVGRSFDIIERFIGEK